MAKKKKKPPIVAIATADWHFHEFKNFNGQEHLRLKWCVHVLRHISEIAAEHRVPILFSGDLLHNPKDVANLTLACIVKGYERHIERRKIKFYGISGNHDLSEKNSIDHRSPSYLDFMESAFNTFWKMDYEYAEITEKFAQQDRIYVAGIPYMNNDVDLLKVEAVHRKNLKDLEGMKILLLHSDIPGAKTPEGIVLDSTEHIPSDLDKVFKFWDLVLCGHIHKAQQISQKVYMLGNPCHQDAGDIGNTCGYWEVYADGDMVFREIKGVPKFIRMKPGEKPSNALDYFLEPDEVLVEEDVEQGEFHLNNSRDKLASKYLAQKKIKSKSKKRALKSVLNKAE